MRRVPSDAQRGYTLTELVIVIGLLALLAAAAVPNSNQGEQKQLDLAAAELAAAIRYARSESIRTGEPHGFRFLANQYQIRVFSTDTSGSPWTWVWDVYHPVSKQLYDYAVPTELSSIDPPVTQTFVYRGTCNTPGTVYFDGNGTPRCLQPETVLLDSYRLDVFALTGDRSIRLDGITGRVAVE